MKENIWRLGMKYKITEKVDVLVDNENLAIYDYESGDVHYISGTGKMIFSLLECKTNIPQIIDKLCEIYSANRNELENDVTEFIKELELKKVVIAYED